MNPKVPETQSGVGASFQGAATYLLHDKAASTDERVAWTETRNIATDDPELAWRVMAATAMDNTRIKREHHERMQAEKPEEERVPFRASKAVKNPVFHYALNWHADDTPTLSREEMMRAAYGSIRALKAEGLQALIVAHNDTDHAHVHVLLNRVDPETGKVRAIDGNAARNLQRFALTYNRERGTEHQAPMREVNAMRRAQGLPYRAEPHVPRHIFEQQREAAAERALNPERADALRGAQRAQDAALAREERQTVSKHRKQWDGLTSDHRRRKAMINADADQAKGQAAELVSKTYEPKWRQLREAHEAERRAIVENERSLAGKIKNTASALKSIWGGRREADPRKVVSGTFAAIGSQGARAEALRQAQDRTASALARDQKATTKTAVTDIEGRRKSAISENYQRHLRDRGDLKLRQAGERAVLRAKWKSRDAARATAWREFRASERLRADYRQAASPNAEKRARNGSADGQKRKLETRFARRSRSRGRDRERE